METFDREFRGEVLQPSTAHLLDERVVEYILAQPHSTLTEGLIRINGKTAGDFPSTPSCRISLCHLDAPADLSAGAGGEGLPFSSFQCGWVPRQLNSLRRGYDHWHPWSSPWRGGI
jgi:hypothetical protein